MGNRGYSIYYKLIKLIMYIWNSEKYKTEGDSRWNKFP